SASAEESSVRRGTSGRARPSRELSDIIEPPQGGGFGGAEEAVLDRGGELAQQGDGGIGLLEQQGGGALALVQRPQQLPGAPALDPGAHRLQGGAQFRRGGDLGQAIDHRVQAIQLEGDRAGQGGVGQQQVQQELGLERRVIGASVGGS